MQLAPETVEELQNAAGFGFDDGLHHQLPTLIQDGDHNRFLVHVHSDIFDVVTHLSCLLGGKSIRANAYLSPQGHNAVLSPIFLCPSAVLSHPIHQCSYSAHPSRDLLKRGRFFIMYCPANLVELHHAPMSGELSGAITSKSSAEPWRAPPANAAVLAR